MSWLASMRTRLRLLFARRAAESRMDEEFRFHLDLETERLVRVAREDRKAPRGNPSGQLSQRDPDLLAMEQHLSDLLGLKVGLGFAGGKGTLTLHYSSLDQLDMICQKLSGSSI